MHLSIGYIDTKIQNGNIVKQSSETVAILLNYITLLQKFNYLQNLCSAKLVRYIV